MDKKHVLNHAILYCKGWYKHCTKTWMDLRRCIIMDGEYMPEKKCDVAHIMLQLCVDNLDIMKGYRKETFTDVLEFNHRVASAFDRYHIWGDVTAEDNDYDYNDAVISVCREALAYGTNIDMFDIILRPNKKVLPLQRQLGESRKKRNEELDKTFKNAPMFRQDSEIYSSVVKYHPLHGLVDKKQLIYPKK